MECYCSSCNITGGVIPTSYKLQEGYLSSQCLIKFSWKVSRSERCFQHVSNLCVTLESHIQLTLITTDFKRELLVYIVRELLCTFSSTLGRRSESSSRRLVPVYQNNRGFFCLRKNQYQLYSSMLAMKSMLLLYFYHCIIPEIRNRF